MAKVIMVQGTMSSAGKSLVVAGLCRAFHKDGYRVAPFKSQNMALNSYITKDGLEMGRAQVMQAEAACIEPDVRMNPILLKPTSDSGSQVIVNGEIRGQMRACEYYEYKTQLIPDIIKAFKELSDNVDIIVIEGAGSPAEINLKENDIVNMGMAKMVDAPVLLVGDIDRGGVFAQLLGTLLLLDSDEKDRVKGLIINKFRGDKSILDPGIEMLVQRGEIPVVGTLPYINITIDDEDSLSDQLNNANISPDSLINIGVVKLPHISNFSDFNIFMSMNGVNINYLTNPNDVSKMDMLIIPGSKNTIGDMKWLRQSGFENVIIKYAHENLVFGICGGYQMLGNIIEDPHMVEEGGSIKGMGLIDAKTILMKEKTRTQTEMLIEGIKGPFEFLNGMCAKGYEIHMGRTEVLNENASSIGSGNGNVYGSYIHGLFDAGKIAESIVSYLASKKGVNLDNDSLCEYSKFKETQYDELEKMIREHMDMDFIYSILKEANINEL